jgi:hypothetical protein
LGHFEKKGVGAWRQKNFRFVSFFADPKFFEINQNQGGPLKV